VDPEVSAAWRYMLDLLTGLDVLASAMMDGRLPPSHAEIINKQQFREELLRVLEPG
jgi:hypothetical protein